MAITVIEPAELKLMIDEGFNRILEEVRREIKKSNDRFVDMKEARSILGVRSQNTIEDWIRKDFLPQPVIRAGRKFFKYSDLMSSAPQLKKYGSREK